MMITFARVRSSKISKTRWVVGIAILTQVIISSRANAVPFSGGIVVERLGGDANSNPGATPLATSTAAPIFLDEFSLSTGTRIQTLALPAGDPDDTGPQRQITERGSSQGGYLSRSANGAYLVTVGYAVPPETTGLGGSGAVNNRVVARVSASGAIDTSTWFSDIDGTPRSAASSDGLSFYVGTANASNTTRFLNFGDQGPATAGIGGGAVRTIAVYGDRVFVSVNATFNSIKDTATGGLPVGPEAGNTVTPLGTITNGNSEQFILLDRIPNVGVDGTIFDTLYMANANNITNANPGGLEKYVFDGVNFNFQTTYNAGLSATNTEPLFGGLLGVAFAGLDGSGNPIIYASTAASSNVGNALVRLVDTGASAAFTLVATAPINTAFRGVAPAPVAGIGKPGDFDGDGDVDGADFVAWQTNFPTASGATRAKGDADGDGDVDGADFVVWQTNFPFTPGPGAAPLPEPHAFALLSIGTILVWASRYRSRLNYLRRPDGTASSGLGGST
jgi:hypothetical protein